MNLIKKDNLEYFKSKDPTSKVEEIFAKISKKEERPSVSFNEIDDEKEAIADMAAMREAFEEGAECTTNGKLISIANKTANDFLKDNIKPLSEEARLAIRGLTYQTASLEEYEEIRLAAATEWEAYSSKGRENTKKSVDRLAHILKNYNSKKFFYNAGAPFLSREEYEEREDRTAYFQAQKEILLQKVDRTEVQKILEEIEEELGRAKKNKVIHK